MQIAIVTRIYSMHWGGAERVAAKLSQKLSEAGHEVHIFCGRAEIDPPYCIKLHIVKFYRILSFLKVLTFHWSVNRIIRKGCFNVVYGHCQFFPLDIYYAGGGGVHRHWMRIRYPSPWIRLLKYLTSPVHLAMIWIERKIFQERNYKFIVTNSKLVKKHIMEYFSIPEKKIRMIYDGVEHDIFNPGVRNYRKPMREKYGIRDDELVLLFVSNNWSRKGLETILKAMTILPSDFKLIVVGRGRPKKYKQKIKELGLEDRVIFTGPTNEVQKFYGMADVFVLPTMYDTFAIVCSEAMASGLPVITTTSSGASEIVIPDKNGYILDDWKDYKGLSVQLLKLIDPSLREKMAQRAFESVQQLTWKKNLDEHIILFKEMGVI